MASKAPARVLTELTPLVFHAPALVKPKTGTSDPELVLMCGWMDASLRTVAKYAAGYGKVFPSSQVLVVRSTSTQFLKRHSEQVADLRKATDFLREEGLLGSAGRKRLLVHTFSNGGVSQLLSIASDSRRYSVGPLDPAAFIFDSCPGCSGLRIMLTAFTARFQSRWARLALYPLVTVAYMFSVLKGYAPLLWLGKPKPQPIENLRRLLQDPSLLAPSPRTYIYSREDQLIPWQAVEKHADDARSLGINVRLERFVGSSHVAHERADSERYWQLVKEAWRPS